MELKPIEEFSHSFMDGFYMQDTKKKYEGGNRQLDFKMLREFIELNKEGIQKVEVGLAEDWGCTSDFVFDNDDYADSLGSAYCQSNWATPAAKITFKNGTLKMVECWKLGNNPYDFFEKEETP